MRARRWIAARCERVGLATLLSGRSGARKGDGFDDDERNADHGSHGSSLRRGVSPPTGSRGSSPKCPSGGLFSGYESGARGGDSVWPKLQRKKKNIKKNRLLLSGENKFHK